MHNLLFSQIINKIPQILQKLLPLIIQSENVIFYLDKTKIKRDRGSVGSWAPKRFFFIADYFIFSKFLDIFITRVFNTLF